MINPRNLSGLKADVFSGHSGQGAKALSKNQLGKGDRNGGDNAFDITKQRIIMENQIFGKLDFTQDLKKNLERSSKETGSEMYEYVEHQNEIKLKKEAKERQQRGASEKDENRETVILNAIDKESLAINAQFFEVDNLKFETMAQYKALLAKDVFKHDQIRRNELDRRSVRRLVLQDEIPRIQEFEEHLERFHESSSLGSLKPSSDSQRHLFSTIQPKNQNNPSKKDGWVEKSKDNESGDSESESSFDSEASRTAFWKDINTNDEDYRNALIIKQVGKNKQRNNQSPTLNYNPRKSQFSNKVPKKQLLPQPLAKLQTMPLKIPNLSKPGVQSRNKELEQRVEKRIADLLRLHQMEIEQIKSTSLQYAIDFFRDRSIVVNKILTQEAFTILVQNELLKDELALKDNDIAQLKTRTIKQEQIIASINEFLFHTVEFIFNLHYKHKDDIDERFQQKTSKFLIAHNKNDPFQLYQIYKRHFEYERLAHKERVETDIYKDLYENMKLTKEMLDEQIESIRDICSSFIHQGEELSENIKDLESKNQTLKLTLEQQTISIESERQTMRERLERKEAEFKSKLETIKQHHAQEILVNEAIISRMKAEIGVNTLNNRKMRAILRVPRLHGKFLEKFKEYLRIQEKISSVKSEKGELQVQQELMDLVGEHGSIEQRAVDEIMATVLIQKKEVNPGCTQRAELVNILEDLDLTPENLSIPKASSPEFKNLKHKRLMTAANIRQISDDKGDLLDIEESKNSVTYNSTLHEFQTQEVPSIMISDRKNIPNFSMTTLRFKRPSTCQNREKGSKSFSSNQDIQRKQHQPMLIMSRNIVQRATAGFGPISNMIAQNGFSKQTRPLTSLGVRRQQLIQQKYREQLNLTNIDHVPFKHSGSRNSTALNGYFTTQANTAVSRQSVEQLSFQTPSNFSLSKVCKPTSGIVKKTQSSNH